MKKPRQLLAGLSVSARGLGGGLAGHAEENDAGVALEPQPDVVLGGRVLVGAQLLAHLLDEVGVAAQQGNEAVAVGAAAHGAQALAGALAGEAGEQGVGLLQVVGRELALDQADDG